MKVAAHPMVVAVALGLLGPTALQMPEKKRAPQSLEDWREVDAPTQEDKQAVADAWARLER
jgi:hypothetical protein